MSGKYIPPALRNKKGEEPIKKLPTIDEFPSLGSSVVRTKTGFAPTRSFALLASEWNEHTEDEKIKKETQDLMSRREANVRERDARSVFTYRQIEEQDTSYYVAENIESEQNTTDDWTTIEKKPKREFSMEEKMARDLRHEAEEKAMEDSSVWNVQHGDDWDYRDRRTTH